MPKSAKIARVTVLILDETNTLSFAAAVDPLRAANRHAAQTLYDWTFSTPAAAPARLTSGLEIPARPLMRTAVCDLLIVVASFGLDPQCTPHLLASLRRLAASAKFVVGIDGGPWVLARAGLLDGQSATTHWEDLDHFAARFPEIETVNARVHTSGKFRTAGGAAPTLDMMRALIAEQHGQTLAGKVAGSFLLETPTPASQPQIRHSTARRHSPQTARAHRLMETHFDAPLSVAEIAKRLGLSPRALQLQFQTHLGTTPQAHYKTLRMAEAERLVTMTDMPLHGVALATGFSSQSSFARQYRQSFGINARAHRQQQSAPRQS